jgi:protein tyrosine phosphatase type 4A
MEFNGTIVSIPLKRTINGPVVGEGAPMLTFIILDAPTQSTLPSYVQYLIRHKVRHLVRVCEKTYRTDVLEFAKINTVAMTFDDGAKPPARVIDQWFGLLDDEISKCGPEQPFPTIAVHCLAGLGRAPFLVALAMIEYAGFTGVDAVQYIRERRPGAINDVQLKFLMKYAPRGSGGGGCVVM